MVGKRKKAAAAAAAATKAAKAKLRSAKHAPDQPSKEARRALADGRRARKLEHRRRDKRLLPTDADWALPAPSGLVGRLERPKVKSKHKSYFEFAENVEKKKKLEFQVTNDSRPPPGFAFVPIGNPTLTNACKEISRARDAMIFIVSSSNEANDRVYQHVSRIGYHFRESIVDDAADIVGEQVVSRRIYRPNEIEPIPESQEDINKEADAAIRDLFPRIPNTDRQMIIDHAFKKGALFQGHPTVGLAPNIPLSRRVQLAVLAHIRHTHTRYDLLLRETEWMNARKVIEPICLDILVKWRGDEETGRDQMEEILREVIVITDSEDSNNSSEEEDDSSEEETEDDSASSSSVSQLSISQSTSSNQLQSALAENQALRGKQHQRGFQRYRAAWDQAVMRQQGNPRTLEAGAISTEGANIHTQSGVPSLYPNGHSKALPQHHHFGLPHRAAHDQALFEDEFADSVRQTTHHFPEQLLPAFNSRKDRVTVRPIENLSSQNTRLYGTVSYATKQPSPVVMGASPTRRSLQDMLVPSIETASSDAVFDSTHREVHRQDGYASYVVERPLQSSLQRQVIVVDDAAKRRRVIYEEDAGPSRSFPSRDESLRSIAPRVDSHLFPASVAQPRNFLIRREKIPSQAPQNLFDDVQPSLGAPIARERLPVHEASPASMYFTLPRGRYRGVEEDHGCIQQKGRSISRQLDRPQAYLEHRRESSYVDQQLYGEKRAFSDTIQRPLPSPFPVSSQTSHADGSGDQLAFFASPPQYRVEPTLHRVRDGLTALPELSRNDMLQENMAHQSDHRPSEMFTTLRPGEAGIPAQYMERPRRFQKERASSLSTGEPAQERYQGLERPLSPQGRPPEGDSPVYVRTIRRPVIVLD